MDEGAEDFVFFGTPIEREEETSSRKRKAIAEAGQLRSLPPWKQEVRDEEGRKRFHGAFTGGFSAGYYNTAGSKEGWTPQTFTSSRKKRAEVKQQNVYNFLDDEDIKDMGGNALETSVQFDTFGFTAAELARNQAAKEQEKRPSAIPGPVPDEIVLPATNSIGVKLLLKMGWRHGHTIKESHAGSLGVAHREARKAFLAFSGNGGSELSRDESSLPDVEDFSERCNDGLSSSQSIPVFVLHPKQDLHGLGYDPFKHAPEFRDRRRYHESTNKGKGCSVASMRGNLLSSNSGKYAPGFGIGALEELDVEDEDIYASGFDHVETEVEEVETISAVGETKHEPESRKQGALSRFKVASSSDYNLERFKPPLIPPDFEPIHKFPFTLETAMKAGESSPPEVPPPEDNSLRLLIDGFATLVSRCGKLFEDISKEKNRSNPLFSFLSGGIGHDYYARKLWEVKQRSTDLQKPVDMKAMTSAQKMTAESRGRILGERPLERSCHDSSSSVAAKEVFHFQSNLSETFTKPATLVGLAEYSKPFKTDTPRQERFEIFLKDKYQGGLRSTYCEGAAVMSEGDRARERLDFEAAAEAIQKRVLDPNSNNHPSISQYLGSLETGEKAFYVAGDEKQRISQDKEKAEIKIYPKREAFEWRPSPILCKRFDITDPFMGKPPAMPKARSKMDSLIFTSDSTRNAKSETADIPNPSLLSVGQTATEPDIEPDTTCVQRPVDLYKAIFSDDSDDDRDTMNESEKTEGANTTLNRLIAGDFLESLGKELGLEVPVDTSPPLNRSTSSKENVSSEDVKMPWANEKATPTPKLSPKISTTVSADGDGPNHRPKSMRGSPNGVTDDKFSALEESRVRADRKEHQSRKRRTHHRRRSSSSDTDSSSHGEYSHRSSRSKSEKRTSSEGKSRKHSSHHGHRRKRSVASDDSDRDLSVSDEGRRVRRSRDRERHSKSHGHKKYH